LSTLLLIVGMLAMVLACGYALWKGDTPARWVGGLVAGAWIGSWVLQDRAAIAHPQYAVAALDVALLVVFAGLALGFRRAWLMVATASQLLTAATHWAFVLDLRIATLGFMTAYYAWSYATLAALVWGTRQAVLARRPDGNTRET
jgi:Kef-type K+ transport system membrane component KefB